MAISVTHATQSTVQDEQVPGEIGPDEWNAGHTVTGAVAAPASTTDKAVARYSGTAGQLQNTSQVTIDDTGVMTINLNSASLPAPSAGTVQQIGQADSAIVRTWMDSFGAVCNQVYRRANGTNASRSALAANDPIGQFVAFGYHSGGAYSTNARALISFVAAEPWTLTATGTYISFATTTNGAAANSEKVRFDDAGNIQMGGANTVITSARHPQLRSYTVATLPSAATAGQWIYVSDETGGATPAFSDATNWRRVSDRAVVA